MKSQIIACLSIVGLLLVSGFANGQDSNGQNSAALLKALKMANTSSFSGVVTIKETVADNQDDNNMRVQVFFGEADMLEPFAGEVKVFWDNGALSAFASEGLSSAKFYKKGSKQFVSQSYARSSSKLNVEGMMESVSYLLDLESLTDEIESLKRIRVKDIGNEQKQFRMTLGKDYFKREQEQEADGMGVMMQDMGGESVIEGVLVATVTQDGNLGSMNLEVQYSDPMAGLMKMMNGGGGAGGFQFNVGGAGGFLDEEEGEGAEKSAEEGEGEGESEEDTPGRLVTITFKKVEKENSTAKAFAAEAAKLLGK